MENQNLSISSNTWYRLSTGEWVIDFCIDLPDVISHTTRFTGKTQVEALENMRDNIVESIDEVLSRG